MSIRRINQNNIASKTLLKAGTVTNASLLLLGSGTNGSTSITDSSIYSQTVNRIGSNPPTISTASFPTGMSSSIRMPGGANYLSIPYNVNYWSYSTDFTIEMYFNFSAHSAYGGIFAASSAGGTANGIQMLFNDTSNSVLVEITGFQNFTSSSSLATNTWNHIALCRVSGIIRLFFNGIVVGSMTNSNTLTPNNSGVYIGTERNATAFVTGYFSNVRNFNNIGLYSSNFTPPALPLANSILA